MCRMAIESSRDPALFSELSPNEIKKKANWTKTKRGDVNKFWQVNLFERTLPIPSWNILRTSTSDIVCERIHLVKCKLEEHNKNNMHWGLNISLCVQMEMVSIIVFDVFFFGGRRKFRYFFRLIKEKKDFSAGKNDERKMFFKRFVLHSSRCYPPFLSAASLHLTALCVGGENLNKHFAHRDEIPFNRIKRVLKLLSCFVENSCQQLLCIEIKLSHT